jgi:hypothetical protein
VERLRGLDLLNTALAVAVVALFLYNLLARTPPPPIQVEAPAFTPPQVVLPTGKSAARRRAEAAAMLREGPVWEKARGPRVIVGADGQPTND